MSIIDEIGRKIKELEKQKKDIQTCCSHPKTAVTETLLNRTRDPLVAKSFRYYCALCDKTWAN